MLQRNKQNNTRELKKSAVLQEFRVKSSSILFKNIVFAILSISTYLFSLSLFIHTHRTPVVYRLYRDFSRRTEIETRVRNEDKKRNKTQGFISELMWDFFFSERDLKCRFIFLPCFFCAQKMQVNSGLRVGRIWGEGGKEKDKKNHLTEMRNMYSCSSVLLQYTLFWFVISLSLFFQTWHYQKKKKKFHNFSCIDVVHAPVKVWVLLTFFLLVNKLLKGH